MATRGAARQVSTARDSRAQLVAAAAEIMTERNSVEFSLSDVATHAGLNAALVKYYFGSKRGLLLAIVEQVATKSLGQLNELLEMNLPPESKLRLHVAGIVKAYVRHPYYNRLIHSLQGEQDPEIARLFVRPLAEAQKRLLKEGVDAGDFQSIDSVFFYLTVIGACDMLFSAGHTLEETFDVESAEDLPKRYAEFIADMLVARLLTPEAQARKHRLSAR